MSQINIKFAELHSALFLAGKNFGLKLDPGKFSGIGLIYDRAEKELLVSWLTQTAIVPSSNIASMTEGTFEPRKANAHHPMIASVSSAQVETPMGHVQAGLGFGKTGKNK